MKSSHVNLSSTSSTTTTTLYPKLQESDAIYSSQEDCMGHDIESSGKDNDLTTDNDGTPKGKRHSYFANTGTSAIELKKMYFKDDDDDDSNEDNGKTMLNEVKTRPVVEKSPEGRFHRFDEELGIGAQKKVYLGYDYDNGREVAWNAIDVSFVEESTILKIRDEIEILKKLRHPNIISFVFCFYNEIKKEIVIITELFSGGSLKHYLKAYKKPRLRVIKLWCQDILTGLEYLHKLPSPIIHRDIKCDNILVNKNTGKVKIGDLGSSCTLKKCGYCKSFNGTAEFCSPEVYIGKYGVKADIYSFGMCLLEMVTNERPYAECEGNVLLICEKATKQILPLCISKIKNIRLYNFIVNCLKPEQERPYATELLMSDFLTDLNGEENDYPALEYPLEEVNNNNNNSNSVSTAISNVNNCSNSKLNASSPPKNGMNKKHKVISPTPPGLAKVTDFLLNKTKEQPQTQSKVSVSLNENEKSNENIAKIVLNKKYKGKTFKIQFDFRFCSDTIEGVVNELQKEFSLSTNEQHEIQTKLSALLSPFMKPKFK